MFDLGLLKWLFPVLGMMSFAEGDKGGSGGDDDKGGDKGGSGDKGDAVSKADHDKVVADLEKSKTDLEDMRMEVLSPEYLEFLNSKSGDKGKGDKGGDDKKPFASDTTLSDEAIEKMSKKELLAEAIKRAEAKYKVDLDKIKTDFSSDKKATTEREVAAFGRAHADFNTYRPVMYGLSIDPKNAGKTLQELYDMAKDHVKGIHTETTAEEKQRQEKLKGEKPGGDSASYERLKKLTPTEAGQEAFAETKKKLGIDSIPSA